jgi:hypothetical protein
MIEVDPRWYLPADYKVVLTHSNPGVQESATTPGFPAPGHECAETPSVDDALAAPASELNAAA